jgi:putative ABC transport system ATP-binding protein
MCGMLIDMPAVIEAKKLQKIFGKGESAFEALKRVDISILPGEVVAIIGKSGSGKSTLMHLLALLDSPTSGSVYVNGQDASKLKRKEIDLLRNRDFGFVFQQFFLNATDSVLSNVVLPLKIAGIPGKERNRRGLEALKAVELEDKAKNKAMDLSGGQKQRVVIARALVGQPKVIFADEPTGNLDSTTGKRITDLLFRLNKEQGITIIFVTHDHDLAKRCQRQISIHDGEIISAGKRP